MRFGYLAIVAAFTASVCAAPVAVANAGLDKRVPTDDGADLPSVSLWKRQAETNGPGSNPGKPWKRDDDDVEAAGLTGPGKTWKRDGDDVEPAGGLTGPGKGWKRDDDDVEPAGGLTGPGKGWKRDDDDVEAAGLSGPGKTWKRDGDDVEAAGLTGSGKSWKRDDDSDDVSAAGLGPIPGKGWKRHIRAQKS